VNVGLARRASNIPAAVRATNWEPWMYLVFLGLSELVSDVKLPFFGVIPIAGIWLHVLLMVLLLLRASRDINSDEGRFYLGVSLLPMVRILSFTMSPTYFHGVWYYFAAEMPLLAAAVVAVYVMELPMTTLGWVRPKSLKLTLLALASGLVVGFGEAFIIHPAKLASSLTLGAALIPALLLIVSTGIVEETVFRGLIQSTSTKWMGMVPGVIYATVSWGLLHIGWNSVLDVLYVTSVGFFWAWIK